MGKTLAANVHVRHPETFQKEVLRKGTELPDWASDIVTNPKAFVDDAETEEAPAPKRKRTKASDDDSGSEG